MGDRAPAAWSTAGSNGSGVERLFGQVRPTLAFLLAYAFLSALENVRYPSGVQSFNVFLPSVDLVVLFGVYAWLGRRGRRVPGSIHALLVALFLLVRFFRLADGFTMRFLRRLFHVHLDSVLMPELLRLLRETGSSPLLLATGGVVVLLAFVAFGYAAHRALRYAERYLANPLHARGYVGVVLLFCVLSLFVREQTRNNPIYIGAFASSGIERLGTELLTLARLPGARAEVEARITKTKRALLAGPNDLAKLGGVDVFLFFVESYGETMLRSPDKVSRVKPAYQAFEAELLPRGFSVVSSLLDAPVAGGGSWFAHATFATGVKVNEQLSYDVLTLGEPAALSTFFRDAGYRTVLVQPGTTRPDPNGGFRHFDQRYLASSFRYRGPDLGWGHLPDQYVIDFVHRREPKQAGRPRFFEYVLVTSHVPWSAELPVLEWSRIGDGSVYHSLPIRHNPARWANLAQMAGAYTATIVYDLEVLRGFIAEFVTDDALVIVLGDHQPNGAVTGDSRSFGVPIHVLSRRRALVEPFLKRGYTEGMWPKRLAPYDDMAAFLPAFLSDFSEPRATPVAPSKG